MPVRGSSGCSPGSRPTAVARESSGVQPRESVSSVATEMLYLALMPKRRIRVTAVPGTPPRLVSARDQVPAEREEGGGRIVDVGGHEQAAEAGDVDHIISTATAAARRAPARHPPADASARSSSAIEA